jgi:hypothetical protein
VRGKWDGRGRLVWAVAVYIKRGRGVGWFGHVGQVWWPLVGQVGRWSG